ncbi:MAG: isocitrate/isopropylmalate dehydrogenase family protein [Deltaproteobacteria bacterium]|nr:isocitrate/isopropylmalate dehydrogenase family protein [Deltaproteobacteria bacterium]
MTTKQVAVIEGEDASPEAVRPVVELIDQMNLGIEWVYPPVGDKGVERFDSVFPEEAKEMIDVSDTTLFGATSGKSAFALLYLRWGKETYANVRPVKFLPGYHSPLSNPTGIDLVIVRENMEDLYLMVEGELEDLAPANLTSPILQKSVADMGPGKYGVKIITQAGTKRVSKFAFELARRRKAQGRPGKVTVSSKYNMLPQSDGLFKEVAGHVAESYPDIESETMIVDNLAHYLVVSPQNLDVVLLPNLYGDILSDAAAGLIGGLGLAPSGCYGENYAYFESAHGTAPDIAGKNIINPTATLLSAAMMLNYIGCVAASGALKTALEKIYKKGRFLTPDQGGTSSTTDFVDAVAQRL